MKLCHLDQDSATTSASLHKVGFIFICGNCTKRFIWNFNYILVLGEEWLGTELSNNKWLSTSDGLAPLTIVANADVFSAS